MNWLKTLFTTSTLSFALLAPLTSSAVQICEDDSTSDDFVVGFFNGVNNTEIEAQLSQAYLMKFHGDTIGGETIGYETFYNHTGSALGSNFGQDLTEVFRQRADEVDPSGYLASRFEIFQAMTSNDAGNILQNLYQTIGATNETLYGLLLDFQTDMSNEALAQVGELFYNPPTLSDYTVHSSRIASLTTQGSALIFVAHSQGNLFANAAYDYSLTIENITENNIGVVHVAPAVTRTVGEHILADKDLVINSLRLTGNVPDSTIDIPAEHIFKDISGHGFIETYMVESIGTQAQVYNAFTNLLDSLTQPEQITSLGAFTATLTWDGLGDADLHIFEPDGNHVFYGNYGGSVGYLDIDNRTGFGPEHYYASCDYQTALTGTYLFGVNNYTGASGKTATLQISTPSIANVLTTSVTLGDDQGTFGNDSPQSMISVSISEIDGKLSLTAN